MTRGIISTKNPLESNLTPCHGEDAIARSPENGFLKETRFLKMLQNIRLMLLS
jgi:hypothetical protein